MHIITPSIINPASYIVLAKYQSVANNLSKSLCILLQIDTAFRQYTADINQNNRPDREGLSSISHIHTIAGIMST